MLVSRIRKTVVRNQDKTTKILQHFNTSLFSRKPCFFVPNNTAYFLQKLETDRKMKKRISKPLLVVIVKTAAQPETLLHNNSFF